MKRAIEQLDLMWNFLQFGKQKSNIDALEEHLESLRLMMTQKTTGQRKERPKDANFDDVWTIINCIVIESMCLYLSGDLEKLKNG